MLTLKALTQLQRELTTARTHLAFLERMAALPPADRPVGILLASADMLMVARQHVAALERQRAEATPQLPLFE